MTNENGAKRKEEKLTIISVQIFSINIPSKYSNQKKNTGTIHNFPYPF
jgi:hypothetical protein